MKTNKQYLGDGVYVEINNLCQIVLTTENGSGAVNNTIYLEPEVYAALGRYVETARLQQERDHAG